MKKKTIIKILILLFLLINNTTFAQPNIKYLIFHTDYIAYDGKTSIDFGDFQVGSFTERYGTILIRNTGSTPLEILSIDIDGEFNLINFDFYIGTVKYYDRFYGTHIPPITILQKSPPYIFDVSFSPTTLGHHTGTLRIYHNAPNYPSPITISLTGNGVNNGSPRLQIGFNYIYDPVSDSMKEIGTQFLNTQAANEHYSSSDLTNSLSDIFQKFPYADVFPLDVTNKGNAPIDISYTITGDEGFYFTLPNDISLQPYHGSVNMFRFVFAPTVPGFHSCTLTLYHNAPNYPSPLTKSFTGNAVTHIVEVPRELDFGNVTIGKSLTKTLTITNHGIRDFTILSYDGVLESGIFTLLNQFPIKIEGYWGEKHNDDLIVQFTPTEIRTYTGTINLKTVDEYLYIDTIYTIYFNGSGTDKEIFIEEPVDIPTAYNLEQNYPNPFNPTTTIQYSIPKDEYVKLVVYDITGRVVKELVNGYRTAGKYNVEFNVSNHASGTYYYKLEAGEYKNIQKMMLIK